jgi:molybdopterin molybdotransferase
MITVQEADHIISAQQWRHGMTVVPLLQAYGRVLAETIVADRDIPPYHRVAMDGIAIRWCDYDNGCRSFYISGTVGAGATTTAPPAENTCLEIMTGAALPPGTDTVIPYEQVIINNGIAEIKQNSVTKGQNIHTKGRDKKSGDLLIPSGTKIGPSEISVAAAVGKTQLLVVQHPRIAIFSSGNELVDVGATPLPYQIRRSNSYAIHTCLQEIGIHAEMGHLPDDLAMIKEMLQKAIEDFDVIVLSGGISMGKYDFIPQALAEISVKCLFHKVKQRPGKPIWFGTFGQNGVVFALPGNPVSTFLCLIRYTMPWLETAMKLPPKQVRFALLDGDWAFEPALQYFLPVRVKQDKMGTIWASPLKTNGSGDFASLLEGDGFLELPAEQSTFKKGDAFRIWLYR